MDLTGFMLLGMIFLILGVLLYIPGHWWAKRKLRNMESDGEYKLHITSAGLAWCVLMVFAWVIGLSQEHLSPGTEFGKFVSTWLGKLYYIVIVAILALVFGLILELFGFKLFRKPNDDE
jgi:uncharacterized membrane protein